MACGATEYSDCAAGIVVSRKSSVVRTGGSLTAEAWRPRAGFLMAMDTKHEDLQSLRIDRSHRDDSGGEPPAWARRYIVGGIAVVVLLGVAALAYRVFAPAAAEVEVVRAATEGGGDVGGVVLSAGRIHRGAPQDQRELEGHRAREVDRRGEGRQGEGRAGAGPAGGRRVSRAATSRPRVRSKTHALICEELQNGSRPEEVQQAQHNLDEARATAANDKITLDRTKELFAQGRGVETVAGRCQREIRSRPAAYEFTAAGFRTVEAGSARRGDCARQRCADASRRAGGVRQVAAGRHHHPRSGDWDDSGTQGGEGRVGSPHSLRARPKVVRKVRSWHWPT